MCFRSEKKNYARMTNEYKNNKIEKKTISEMNFPSWPGHTPETVFEYRDLDLIIHTSTSFLIYFIKYKINYKYFFYLFLRNQTKKIILFYDDLFSNKIITCSFKFIFILVQR